MPRPGRPDLPEPRPGQPETIAAARLVVEAQPVDVHHRSSAGDEERTRMAGFPVVAGGMPVHERSQQSTCPQDWHTRR